MTGSASLQPGSPGASLKVLLLRPLHRGWLWAAQREVPWSSWGRARPHLHAPPGHRGGATHASQDKKRLEDSAGSAAADNYWWERRGKFRGGLMPVTNGIIKSSFCIASIWLREHLFTRGLVPEVRLRAHRSEWRGCHIYLSFGNFQ